MKNLNTNDEIIDLEEIALSGKHPNPHARKFRIKIDNQKFDVDSPTMFGRDILKLVGKSPERCQLRQKAHGKVMTIGPDQTVDFTVPGIERFTTLCSDVTDGGM